MARQRYTDSSGVLPAVSIGEVNGMSAKQKDADSWVLVGERVVMPRSPLRCSIRRLLARKDASCVAVASLIGSDAILGEMIATDARQD